LQPLAAPPSPQDLRATQCVLREREDLCASPMARVL
jgi:hypothetical protein